jgi:hypothetical protein
VKLELRTSQSFLIGRPADGGTKLLRKHESATPHRLPGHLSAAPIGIFVIAPFANSVDNTAHLRGVPVHLRSVNRNRKGLRDIGKKHPRVFARPKPALIRTGCIDRPRGKTGNGEQAWL